MSRAPALHYRSSGLTEWILRECPLLHQPFVPSPWCSNAHLQLGLGSLLDAATPGHRFDRVERLTLADGGLVSLEWAGFSDAAPGDTPTLLVLPTLCGDGQSLRRFVRSMRSRLGWRVVVCNSRGHAGVPLSTPRMQLLGSTDDLREQISAIRTRLPRSTLYAVGLSAGSALLVRYLGEEGSRAPIAAAVAVCPGYDAARAFSRVVRAYDVLMTRSVKEQYLRRHRDVLRNARGYEEARASRSLGEFHRAAFGLAGFDSFDEYDRATNPMVVADGVRRPLLVLNAEDDPVCVRENVAENVDRIRDLPNALLALTARGSHCAFFEGTRPRPWADRVIAQYLRAVQRHEGPRGSRPRRTGSASADE